MLSDAEVIQLMREFLTTRLLTPGAGLGGNLPANMDMGWPEPAAEAPAPAPGTPPVNLNTLPDPPVVPPLLPILEEVQMQNAAVLPEIDQTLAQIDTTMADIETASVSLEPAPLQLPKIKDSMTDASAAVDKTLGEI